MYRPYMYNNATRNTNEIRTVSTALISFGSDGKVNWDHSFKLDEMRMPGLEQVSDYVMKNDQLYFLYKKESDLKLKAVSLQDGQALENSLKVQTNDPLDEIRSEKEFEGGVRQWLDGCVLCLGISDHSKYNTGGQRTRCILHYQSRG